MRLNGCFGRGEGCASRVPAQAGTQLIYMTGPLPSQGHDPRKNTDKCGPDTDKKRANCGWNAGQIWT
jgi:hypothetical protein